MSGLDKEQAREVLLDAGVHPDEKRGHGQPVVSDLLDRLEACVTPDEFAGHDARYWAVMEADTYDRLEAAEEKLAAVEVLCVRWEQYPYMVQIVDDLRAALRGDHP